MKLELEIKTKEEAEKLIKQLQEFVEGDKLHPDIEEESGHYKINSAGQIEKSYLLNVSTEYLANIYKTQEIAVKALQFKKSRKVWNFIENWAMHNSTFKIDWNDIKQYRYSVYYSYINKKWYVVSNITNNGGDIIISRDEAYKLVEILNSSDEYKL